MSAGGRVFNLQRFSLHDGPGIRTTVFLKGCPARCAWCHNPESQSPLPELIVVETRCASCGECRRVCPHGAPSPREGACQTCGACVDACPAGARELVGREMTVAEVMTELRRDSPFYQESGGGATFSGGEPLAQPAFLRELLEACRSEGIATAVDTCGFAPRQLLLGLAPLVDVFLFDVKLLDDARHRELTGLPIEPILDNLRALSATHRNVWVRIPVVPGHTDEPADLERTAALLQGLRGVRRVSLLPYHRTGADKARRLGRAPGLEQVTPPSGEHLESLATIFRNRGLSVAIGG